MVCTSRDGSASPSVRSRRTKVKTTLTAGSANCSNSISSSWATPYATSDWGAHTTQHHTPHQYRTWRRERAPHSSIRYPSTGHGVGRERAVAAGEVVDKGEDYDATLEGELDVLQLCLHALQDRDPPRAVLGILLDQHLEKRRVLAPALLARRVHDHRHRRSRQHVVDLAAPDRQVQHPHAVAPATDERQLHLLQVARHQLLRRDINQVEPDPAQREADRQHPCGPDPHAPARCPLLVLVLVLALSHRPAGDERRVRANGIDVEFERLRVLRILNPERADAEPLVLERVVPGKRHRRALLDEVERVVVTLLHGLEGHEREAACVVDAVRRDLVLRVQDHVQRLLQVLHLRDDTPVRGSKVQGPGPRA
eukprot:3838632-Rhodomonas_salina.2